jgi:predicted nucleic acid-binding protein
LSPYILDELRRVLTQLRPSHGLSDAEIADLVDRLSFDAESVTPEPHHTPELTAPFDQAILGTLIAAEKQFQAKYLIASDKALLACASRYAVLSPAEFWAVHGAVG